MGACSSCLGLNRRTSHSDPSDTSQLLGEGYPAHYGSTITTGAPAADPEEIRRQRDILERLCVSTSDKLIDVSTATQPSDVAEATGVRPAHEYPRIFTERFAQLTTPHLTSEDPSRSTSVTQHNSDNLPQSSHSSSRPASSGRADTAEAQQFDEATWLANALKQAGFDQQGEDEDGLLPWERVIGAEQARGTLTKDFFADFGAVRPAIKA